MKHFGLLKQFLLLFALIVGSTSVWAEDVTETINLSEQGYTNSQQVSSTEGEVVTLTYTDGTTPTAYYNTGNGVRVYYGGKMTITAKDYTITKVIVTFAKDKSPTISMTSNGTTTSAGTTSPATWEGSATEVYFNVSEKGHARIQTVDVTYTITSSNTPSISANNVNIAYNATNGAISYSINNPADGGILSANTEDDWLEIGTVGETVPFTCSANEENTARTAMVTLTYTYNTEETFTKNVTITQAAAPVVYSTIPALFAAATSTATDVKVTFNNWVVSGISTNGKNVFVTDGTNGFVIYSSSDQSSTYSVGDILSGTAISCSLKMTNGYAQISVDSSDLTISSGGTISAADIALADLAGVNTGALVSYENLTCSINSNKYYLSDGTTTIQLYNSLYAFGTLEAGKKYNITGIYQQYSSTKEILPRSANDIVEYVSTEPSIDVSTNKVEVTAAETEGTITVTYNNITEIVAQVQFYDENGTTELTGNDAPSWIQAEINGDNNVYYLIGENEGEARTAYMKVYALDDDGNDVYSELITVTQAKPVVMVNYTLATAVVPGKHYIITSGTNGEIMALGKQTNNYREQVSVTADNGSLSVEDNAGVYEFLIKVDNATGFYTLYDVAEGKYLFANSNSSNNINVEDQLDNKNNGVWAIEISSDGVATIKAQGANERNWIRYNSGNTRFSCYGETNSMADVYLFERDNDDSPVQTTIIVSPATDKTYTTFCRAIDLDFTNVSGIEAYIVSGLTESSASIKKVNKVPAGEGIILKRTGTDESFDIPFAESAEPIAKNYMVGVTKEKDMTNVTNAYILSGGLFYECSGGKLAAGKAYLNDEDGVWAAAAGAPSFSIIVDGETTGIENVKGEAITNSQYYTLDGRRVAAPTKGIYIVNGKKVVVK
ncbi:MAG: hypothetical protein IJP46_02435 [Prevotella sp.]|nr:hypothetical protein [Prevotella sp.]